MVTNLRGAVLSFINALLFAEQECGPDGAGTLSNWGVVDEALCRELIGYIETILAHGNCKRVRLEHPQCRAHGAADCVFTGTWQ